VPQRDPFDCAQGRLFAGFSPQLTSRDQPAQGDAEEALCTSGGLVPWGQVFAALREIAFDGYLILEAYNSALDDFARRRGMFHDVCPDGAAFVRRGFAFLREGTGTCAS
jgi:hypothetical protein